MDWVNWSISDFDVGKFLTRLFSDALQKIIYINAVSSLNQHLFYKIVLHGESGQVGIIAQTELFE